MIIIFKASQPPPAPPTVCLSVLGGNIDHYALNGHNGQKLYDNMGLTSILTKKYQSMVFEVGNPIALIAMVKSQTSIHIQGRPRGLTLLSD